jgi:hypothetical protein
LAYINIIKSKEFLLREIDLISLKFSKAEEKPSQGTLVEKIKWLA